MTRLQALRAHLGAPGIDGVIVPPTLEATCFKAVPHHLWANRQAVGMLVWLLVVRARSSILASRWRRRDRFPPPGRYQRQPLQSPVEPAF